MTLACVVVSDERDDVLSDLDCACATIVNDNSKTTTDMYLYIGFNVLYLCNIQQELPCPSPNRANLHKKSYHAFFLIKVVIFAFITIFAYSFQVYKYAVDYSCKI